MTRTKPPKQTNKKEHKNSPKSKCTPELCELAYRLALLGLSQKEMAKVMDISIQTLDKYVRINKAFREAIWNGSQNANANVAQALYQRAIGYSHEDTVVSIHKGEVIKTKVIKHYPPSEKAAFQFLRNRTRTNENPWSEKSTIEVTGKGGGPIETKTLKSFDDYDLSDCSKEELETALKIFPQLQDKIMEAIKQR